MKALVGTVLSVTMPDSGVTATRAISLTREGSFLRCAFPYDPNLLARIKAMPYAGFDGATKTWTVLLCAQSVDALRQLHWEGRTDVSVDSLLEDGEQPAAVKAAMLRRGSMRRPFVVATATRDDRLYARLKAIPGARWEGKAGGLSYGPTAATALAELVDRGVLDDPERILAPADVVVTFDGRNGKFHVRGDERAQRAFEAHFPKRDVMAAWQAKNLDVAFSDDFTEEVYRGEMAKLTDGVQPEGMAIELYPYQRQDVAVALERSGLGLFGSMGVGKTILGIATGHELVTNRQAVTRVVVVVPPAVRTQWRNEIIRFTGCPDSDVVVIDGNKKTRMAQYAAAANAKWLIVHYQAVILPDDYKALSKLAAGSLLIADECHRMKNETATTTKKMRELNRKAARRLGLSGTPVENNPGEWFNLISGFIQPGIFGSPIDFLNRYAYPGKFGGFEGAKNIPELRERSKAFYVRRTLNEVAPHLPKMRVQTIVLEPRPEYASALRRAHNEARDEIAAARLEVAKRKGASVLDGYEREEIETGAEMTAVGMLKLLCSSPHLIAQSDSPAAKALRDAGIVPDEDGPKLDEIRVMAAEMQANGERLVIFTSSKRMANLVAERFAGDGIRHVLYTGDTKSTDRDKAQEAFITPPTDENPGPTAFISTDAGAEGLNLGRCCSTLVNLDVPWTPGRLGQRNARVRRIDSTATSFLVVNLVLAGTIEKGILRMVEQKADLADAILGESGGRKATTGRAGRNIFEAAMADWVETSKQKAS